MIKKSALFSIILSFVGVFAFASFVFAQNVPAVPADLPVITHLEGSVLVKSEAAGLENPAVRGMILQQGSVIITSDQSYCDIAFDKEHKNIVSVGPNSKLTIGKDLAAVNLSKGRVFSRLKNLPPGSKFEVVTPQAITGARGTAWESIVEDILQFNVEDSTIYVLGLGQEGNVTSTNDVGEGFSINVGEGGLLGQINPLSSDDIQRMDNWSNRIDQSLTTTSGENQNTSPQGNDQQSNQEDSSEEQSSAAGDEEANAAIDSYEGETSNLFEQVMETTAGELESAFAGSDSNNPLTLPTEIINPLTGSNPTVTGGDVTPTTFIANQPSSSSPQTEESSSPAPSPLSDTAPAPGPCVGICSERLPPEDAPPLRRP